MNEVEAFALEVASGALEPIFWPDIIMAPVINTLMERRLLAHADCPEPSSTDGAHHYHVLATAAGLLMLTLYRQGIR